jgi:hypothetical protein
MIPYHFHKILKHSCQNSDMLIKSNVATNRDVISLSLNQICANSVIVSLMHDVVSLNFTKSDGFRTDKNTHAILSS